MPEPIKLDRTWLCSVVFVDIVQYSLQSLETQTLWKQRFNQYLADTLKDGSESDRVTLDTGDGAAICFLGDPETAMFCALRLVSEVANEKAGQPTPFRVRVGINLGSVKLVRDINGNPNAVGDGINVSQRIMSFAHDNQILVSRSFYEVASSLSESHADFFKYEGVRTDKHVREHTIYELHPPHAGHRHQTPPEPAANWTGLSASQMEKVESALAYTLGPIARHLLRNAIQKAHSASDLKDTLLGFVPDGLERKKFIDACGNIFGETTSFLPTSVPAPPIPEKSSTPLDAATLDSARKELAVFIGPMARVLVDRAAVRATTKAELFQLLAGEITSAPDRESFLKNAGIK